ncbi:helix-turn-helix transcriptional regulator [Jatrophihabitans sp.]|uniref:helix-turn-helix transcriptional regulator n=1 Tax=Jatrophihabitans sp. TaxID=1932789 RepID=UPI0030C761FD|nr:AraC-type DNA-binding protein [Jatrophihabitans sp.]
MSESASRVDLPPPGGIAWLDVSSRVDNTWAGRARTGPLGMQIAPLPYARAPYLFRGARLRGTRCIWTAATVSGAELWRRANSFPSFADGAVHILVRAEVCGSVFDPAGPFNGTLRVVEPLVELREVFPANTHLFTLNVQRGTLGVDPGLVSELQEQTFEVTEFQAQLLRSAVGMFRGGGEELSSPGTLVGVDRYLGALAGLLLRTAVLAPTAELEQMESIRSRADTVIVEQAGDPLLTPAAVAGQLNISLRQLYRAFTGSESPAALIRRRRLEHAAELLTTRTVAVQVDRVASECGFASAEYFSRAFRREYGVSPRAYRSAHRDQLGGPTRVTR